MYSKGRVASGYIYPGIRRLEKGKTENETETAQGINGHVVGAPKWQHLLA